MNRNDRRYQRTHAVIRNRFEELIIERELHEITVSELSRRAGINRKTFYLHFTSLNEVLEELQEEIMKELSCLEPIEWSQSDPFDIEALMEGFSAIISRNIPLHRRLFCSGGYNAVFEHIRRTVTRRYVRTLQDRIPLDNAYVETATSFVSYGILFVFRDWLASDRPMEMRDLTRYVSALVRGTTGDLAAEAEREKVRGCSSPRAENHGKCPKACGEIPGRSNRD